MDKEDIELINNNEKKVQLTEKKKFTKKTFCGILTAIGGVTVQSFNGGIIYLWPAISIYIISYLYEFDKSID